MTHMTLCRSALTLAWAGVLCLLAPFAGQASPLQASRVPAGTSAQMPDEEWGVQLAGAFSREQTLAAFDRIRMMLPSMVPDGPPVIVSGPLGHRRPSPFYRARIPTGSRTAAGKLCGMIRAANGSCVVLPMTSPE